MLNVGAALPLLPGHGVDDRADAGAVGVLVAAALVAAVASRHQPGKAAALSERSFQFVHNAKKCGKALLSAHVETIIAPSPRKPG